MKLSDAFAIDIYGMWPFPSLGNGKGRTIGAIVLDIIMSAA